VVAWKGRPKGLVQHSVQSGVERTFTTGRNRRS
jgi:hypothetical protein